MKKLLALFGCIVLLFSATALQAMNAQTEGSPVFPAKKVRGVTRSAKDPLALNLLGRVYLLAQSMQNDDQDGWDNIYVPAGEITENDTILISNLEKTTCAEVLEDATDDIDDFLSVDSRNPQDQMISALEETDDGQIYRVGRVIQHGPDVFYLIVMVPHEGQPDAQWLQLQKDIYAAVQRSAKEVLTENFVQSVCKFGADCRAE